MVDLTICLLCSGKGAEAQSYRPNLDESQWWGRRDALVRCVAASLYGPRNTKQRPDRIELCLLFDEDGCVMRMQSPPLGLHQDDVPTERRIVSMWRAAASEAGRSQKPAGFGFGRSLSGRTPEAAVTCIQEPWTYASGNDTSGNDEGPLTASSAPTAADIAFDMSRLESKRDILEHIQQRCPLEFLRKHRLNSGADVVLRKTNRAKLLAAWKDWVGSVGEGNVNHSGRQLPAKDQKRAAAEENTEETFRAILLDRFRGSEGDVGNRTNEDPTVPPPVMAAVLHESMDNELPCWEGAKDEAGGPARLCLFLGAVRDMTNKESDILTKVCSALNIPLIGFRLGPVPEFTSKILSVVTYHNAVGALGPAAWLMWKRKQNMAKIDREANMAVQVAPRGRRRLHMICDIPMSSAELTHDLSARSRTLWCVVRLCVCALWRSKLASSSASTPTILENTLSFVFEDDIVLTLEQEDLVKTLAEKHQAAPSEHQILVALCQKRDEAVGKSNKPSIKRLVKKSIKEWRNSLEDPQNSRCYCLGISKKNKGRAEPSLIDSIYSNQTITQRSTSANALIFAHLAIRNDESDDCKCASVFQKLGIPVFTSNIIQGNSLNQDAEASAITMLQHFEYQQRLLPAIYACVGPETVKRKKQKKKAKKRKREDLCSE